MNMKITSTALAALMIAGTTSFSAFASMGSGTVVIGTKAFDFEYANNPVNAAEINAAIIASGGAVYVKDFQGNWLDNSTGLAVAASSIPTVTYTDANGVKTTVDTGDVTHVGTTVSSVSAITALTVENGTTANNLGLPSTVGVTLSDGTTDFASVTWNTTAFDGTKAGTVIENGTLSVPAGKTWTLTDAQKAVSVSVTVKAVAGMTVSSDSVINATTMQVVLADKPAKDLTVVDAAKFDVTVNGVAVAAPTAVIKVASDLTGKTYKLTIATLDGQQGDVAVNGTKVAVATGMVYGFDYSAPTLQSVTAKGTKTLELQFSEKLDATAANIVAASFGVYKNGTSIGTTNTAILDSTGTKVTITLSADMTVADYVVKLGSVGPVVNVKDVAGNGIFNGTEVSFRPTAAQLADTSAPALTKAVYNKVSGILTLSLNKNITTMDVTKLSINGVALTSSDTAVNVANVSTITISAATKTALNALTGVLTLTSAKNAYGDANLTTGETFAVSLQQPAIITSLAYDQQSNKLTATFDQAVTLNAGTVLSIDDVDQTGSAVIANTDAIKADGTAADTTIASTTWTFDATAVANTIETATVANLKGYIVAGAVTNGASVANVAGQETYAKGVKVDYAADVTKPTLANVQYNNNTNQLVLTFSEKIAVNTANTNAANIKLYQADGIALTGLTSLSGLTATETAGTTSKTLTYNLNSINRAAVELALNTGKTVKATIDATVAKDEANLLGVATTYATGTPAVYKDYKAPTLTGGLTVSSKNSISVKFAEPVDATTASNVSNYVITDPTGAKLEVKNAAVQTVNTDGTMTVLLTTADQTTSAPYALAVSNVKDVAGNIMATDNTLSFNGSSIADVTALTVNTLAVAAPANSKNDTLTVGFNAVPDSAKALDLNNYVVLQSDTNTAVGWANATEVSLTNAKATFVSGTPTNVKITLDSVNLQNGKFYKVIASNVTTVTGKALGNNTGDVDAISDALVATAPTTPIVSESQTATSAVKLVFDEELTGADVAANYTVAQAATNVTKATYSWDATKGKATVILDLDKKLASPSIVTLTSVNAATVIKNLAGTSFASAALTLPGTLADNVAPTVKSIDATINNGKLDDTIAITFNDNDILNGSTLNVSNYVIKDSLGKIIPSTDYVVTGMSVVGGNDVVTLTFNGNTTETSYNLQASGTYTVSTNGVLDMSGNAITAVTNTATLVNAYKDGDIVSAVTDGTVTVSPVVLNNVTLSGADTATVGNITITTANVDIKKASASDFGVRVYDANGQVALSDSTTTLVKTLLFGQLTGGTSKQLVANISMNYGQLKTAMNNLSGSTVSSIQVDLYDLAGNKTIVTLTLN